MFGDKKTLFVVSKPPDIDECTRVIENTEICIMDITKIKEIGFKKGQKIERIVSKKFRFLGSAIFCSLKKGICEIPGRFLA